MRAILSAFVTDVPGTLRRVANRRFSKDVALLAGGSFVAQVVTIIASPIVTRLYGPAAFGILGVFLSVTDILMPAASLAYTHAIVLPRNDSEGLRLFNLALGVSVAFSLLVGLALICLRDPFLRLFDAETIRHYLFLIPVFIVLSTAIQAQTQWLIRKRSFTSQGRIAVACALAGNAAKIGSGALWPSAALLVAVATFQNLLNVVMLGFATRRSGLLGPAAHAEGPLTVTRAGLREIRDIASRYRDFPFFRAPQLLLNTFSKNLPVMALAALFNPAAAGFFSLSNRMLLLPSEMVGKAVASVFFSRVAEAANRGESLFPMIVKTTLVLAGLGIVPFGLMALAGPELFSWVFGRQWAMAGEYARWMSPLLFANFLARPSSQSLLVQNRQKFLLFWDASCTVTTFSILVIGGYLLKNQLATVAAYSLAGTFFYTGIILKGLYCALRERVAIEKF